MSNSKFVSPTRSGSRRAGFTMIELLVVVGIVVLLSGLVLAGVLAARKHAYVIRGKSDLQLISTALQAYNNEFNGQYPVFATPAEDQNNTSAGNGQWLDYKVNGVNGVVTRGAVLLCRAMIGPGAAASSTTTPAVANPGDDGADGVGFRIRRNYNASTGQLSGKVYGPYVDPSKFRIKYLPLDPTNPMAYPVIVDSNGNPILYFPATPGTYSSNAMWTYIDPKLTGTPTPGKFNWYDNAYVPPPAPTPVTASNMIQIPMSSNDLYNLTPNCGTLGFLLWSAGADGTFGFDKNKKCDDITNFDLPAQYQK